MAAIPHFDILTHLAHQFFKLYLSLKKVLTGSEGPQKSLNTFEGSNCLISIAMQGPEHNSETISWKRKKTEKKVELLWALARVVFLPNTRPELTGQKQLRNIGAFRKTRTQNKDTISIHHKRNVFHFSTWFRRWKLKKNWIFSFIRILNRI